MPIQQTSSGKFFPRNLPSTQTCALDLLKVDKNEFHLVDLPLNQTKGVISITPVPLLLLSVVYLAGFSIIKSPRFYSYFILFLDCTLTNCKACVLLSVTLLQLSILSYNIIYKLKIFPSEKLVDTHKKIIVHFNHSRSTQNKVVL